MNMYPDSALTRAISKFNCALCARILYFCFLQVGDDPPGRMVSTTKK